MIDSVFNNLLVEETHVEETPRIQCGPGTTLEDIVCVLDSIPQPTSSTFVKVLGKELIIVIA